MEKGIAKKEISDTYISMKDDSKEVGDVGTTQQLAILISSFFHPQQRILSLPCVWWWVRIITNGVSLSRSIITFTDFFFVAAIAVSVGIGAKDEWRKYALPVFVFTPLFYVLGAYLGLWSEGMARLELSSQGFVSLELHVVSLFIVNAIIPAGITLIIVSGVTLAMTRFTNSQKNWVFLLVSGALCATPIISYVLMPLFVSTGIINPETAYYMYDPPILLFYTVWNFISIFMLALFVVFTTLTVLDEKMKIYGLGLIAGLVVANAQYIGGYGVYSAIFGIPLIGIPLIVFFGISVGLTHRFDTSSRKEIIEDRYKDSTSGYL